MNKTVKRIIRILIIIAILCGAVWGGLILLRNAQKKPVNVYAVTDFSTSDDYGSTSQTYGMVTMDNMQKIVLTESQTVEEILVKEGDTVKKGDPILSYDTTLSDIDLKKAKIEVDKLELEKKNAENELAKLKKLKPHSRVLITPPTKNITYEPQKTPLLLSGSGTKSDPFYYLWDENDSFETELLSQMFPGSQKKTPASTESKKTSEGDKTEASKETQASSSSATSNESYVVLVVRENNALNGQVLNSWGLHLTRSGGEIKFKLFQATLPEDMQQHETNPEPYYEESGSEYTAAELTKMKAEKEQEIKDLDVSIKIAKLELKQKEKETNDGTVCSTIDGTVKAVRDPDEAFKNNEPVIEVSAGGGYYIDGALSELELETVQVGQTVQVNSWMTGTSCEGEIVEISSYPTNNANSWSEGNTNVSYYPFRIFVDESADLTENDNVDITYQNQVQEEGSSNIFLENSFIRTENGKSFIYIRNEEGLLEQRTVQTGRDLYGYYTEIRGGLTAEDYIAFPYGNDVTDGAKTTEATPDALYEN